MDKLIPISILIGIIILGFIMKSIELSDVVKRTDFTNQYHNKFIRLIDVKTMQYELGSDGVYAHVMDNLNGFSASNYQLLVNFLPELRDVHNNRDNFIMMNRYNQSAKDCDDMFIRHLGSLNEFEKSIRKKLFNPFSCFSDGMRFIVTLPILLLNWFGLISDENTRKAKRSWFIRFLNFITIIIGLIGSIMTIILGWSGFIQKLSQMF